MKRSQRTTIEQVIATPGMYVAIGAIGYYILESENGNVHQCKPVAPFPRDGLLSRDGWNYTPIFIGPFARKELT